MRSPEPPYGRRMRRLLLTATVLLALLGAATGCADQALRATTPQAPTTPPSQTSPASTPPPPDGGETSAVSLDTQARLTGEGGLVLLQRCHEATGDYARCGSAAPTELGSHPSVPWGSGLGEVLVRTTASTFVVDSRSHSGAHFLIRRTADGATHRDCSGSATECETGHWAAVPGVAAMLG